MVAVSTSTPAPSASEISNILSALRGNQQMPNKPEMATPRKPSD